jgi:hypothetical protein
MMFPFVEDVVESTKSGSVFAKPFTRAHGFDFCGGDDGSTASVSIQQWL